MLPPKSKAKVTDNSPFDSPSGRVTNQQIFFMLGRLMADQTSTIDLIRMHIADDEKKWEHIYRKTDRIGTVVTWAAGVAASLGAIATLLGSKLLGMIH